MTKSEKQSYNRENYLKNRDRILEQSKIRWKRKSKGKIVPISGGPGGGSGNYDRPSYSEPIPRRSRASLALQIFVLSILVAGFTNYLISEAAKFYATTEGQGWSAIYKASIGESIVILFSFLANSAPETNTSRATRRFWSQIVNKGALVIVGIYSVLVVCGGTVVVASQDQKSNQITQSNIAEIETELKNRIAVRERLQASDRISAARRVSLEIENIQKNLKTERANLKSLPDPVALQTRLWTLILFRALVLFANIAAVQCWRSVFRQFSESLR